MAPDPQDTVSEQPPPWWEPGVVQVADGVYRIPLPMPHDGLRAINVYAVTTGAGIDLVDAGWATRPSRDALVAGLAELDASLADVRRIFATHAHHDHYTQAVHIRREFGATVALGEGERPSLELLKAPQAVWDERQEQLVTYFGAAHRMTEFNTSYEVRPQDWDFPDRWLSDDTTVEIGDRVAEVVATPGHTQGHVVFHDTAHDLLFAGDHVLPTITPSVGLEGELAPNPLGDFLNSLAKVRARPDAMLLPAHGIVTDSVHRRVDELVAHHATRLAHSLEVLASGAGTSYEVAEGLRWTRRDRVLHELDLRNQWLAIRESAAHLNVLVAQGRAEATTRDGVCYYRVATRGSDPR